MSPAIIAAAVAIVGAAGVAAFFLMSSKGGSGGNGRSQQQGGPGQQPPGAWPPQQQQGQQQNPWGQQQPQMQQQNPWGQPQPQMGQQQPSPFQQQGLHNPFPQHNPSTEATLPPMPGNQRPGAPPANMPAPPIASPPKAAVKDRKRTVAMSFSPGGGDPGQAAPGSMHYTPVLTTIFGDTNPSRLVIENNEVIIGRSSDVDYSLDDDAASRQHAKLIYVNYMKPDEPPMVNVMDMNSRNGLLVNGQKVNGSMVLPDNARIVIGQIQMGFYLLGFPKQGANLEAPSGGRASASPSRQDNAAGRAAAPAVPLAKLCIVDNDFGFAADLRGKLEKTGRYSVIVYRSLDTAQKGFSSGPPQMLLLDADMPGMNMVQALQSLKADPNWAGVPIILLFNEMNQERMRSALKAGAQSYLTKPISNLSLLTSRIDIHMNINRMIAVRR